MSDADVLIVGAGPAGAITALELARAGHRVVAIDQRPSLDQRLRSGAILSPRALAALDRYGVHVDGLGTAHRIDRVRITAAHTPQHSTSTEWPRGVATGNGSMYPTHGLVVDRRELDRLIADTAAAQGAEVRYGVQAAMPVIERGFVRGARVSQLLNADRTTGDPEPPAAQVGLAGDQVTANYTVVADGANSRFGRALGTFRNPRWPHALGHRGRYSSDLADTDEIEILIGLQDRSGEPVSGLAWMAPCGDGTVVVGVLINSTSPGFRVVTPDHLLAQVIGEFGDRWRLDPTPTAPTGGNRLPLGTSIQPIAGPTYLLVGDAAGAANPFTGVGLEYAIETGAIAAEVIDRALDKGVSAELQRYPSMINERYGDYFKLGRLANRLFGSPGLAPAAASAVAGTKWASKVMVRVAINELDPRPVGLAELIVRGVEMIDPVLPSA